jgi:hypothetical protein
MREKAELQTQLDGIRTVNGWQYDTYWQKQIEGHKNLDIQDKGGTSVKLEQTVLCTPWNTEKEHHKSEHFSVAVTTYLPYLRGICLKLSWELTILGKVLIEFLDPSMNVLGLNLGYRQYPSLIIIAILQSFIDIT